MLLKPSSPKSIQNSPFALEPWTSHDNAELNALVARMQRDAREGIENKRARAARSAVSNSARSSTPIVSLSGEEFAQRLASPEMVRERERERIQAFVNLLKEDVPPEARKLLIQARDAGLDCSMDLLRKVAGIAADEDRLMARMREFGEIELGYKSPSDVARDRLISEDPEAWKFLLNHRS